MKITYVAAGSGQTYCGACMRDVALVRGLMAEGHDVTTLPLYIPLSIEGPSPAVDRIFYSGINAWLQQHCGLFRRNLGPIDWLLDRPALLKLISRFAIQTSGEGLGPMTVSVLKGRGGNQRKELERLMSYLEALETPDVVNLTNSLLSAIAPEVRERFGVPVVCGLQGEEEFVDTFAPEWRRRTVDLIRSHAESIDLFTAPYESYADRMTDFLGVERDRVRIVPPGVDMSPYGEPGERQTDPFRIGFLSPICHNKGADILCEAFCRLAAADGNDARLCVAGELQSGDREFWRGSCRVLEDEGLGDRLENRGHLDQRERVEFLKSLSVFAMPSRVEECRGVPCIEALACGVPIVVPRRGILPDIVERTGGGLVVPPDDPDALSDTIARLRDDPEMADQMGRKGREGVHEHYSGKAVAAASLRVYEEVMGGAEKSKRGTAGSSSRAR